MIFLPTKKHPAPPTPPWMRVGLVGFMVAMAIVGYQNEQKAKQGDPTAVSIKKYEVLQQFGDLERWRRVINPSRGKEVEFEELKPGQGEVAACGQQVMLHATQLKMKGDTITPQDTEQATFTIGDGSVNVAWDKGVRGMKADGVRRIWAGAQLVNPTETNLDAKPQVYDLELLSLVPNLTKEESFQRTTMRDGSGYPARCGATIDVMVNMTDDQDKPLYETPEQEPLTLTIGQSDYGHGLDRAALGMMPEEVRRAIIPPPFQRAKTRLPFPLTRPVIVEITRRAIAPSSQPSPSTHKE